MTRETLEIVVLTDGTTFMGGVHAKVNGKRIWSDFDGNVKRLTREDAEADANSIARWHLDINKIPDFIGTIRA